MSVIAIEHQSSFDIGVAFWLIESLRLRHLNEMLVDRYLPSVHAARTAVGSGFAAGRNYKQVAFSLRGSSEDSGRVVGRWKSTNGMVRRLYQEQPGIRGARRCSHAATHDRH